MRPAAKRFLYTVHWIQNRQFSVYAMLFTFLPQMSANLLLDNSHPTERSHLSHISYKLRKAKGITLPITSLLIASFWWSSSGCNAVTVKVLFTHICRHELSWLARVYVIDGERYYSWAPSHGRLSSSGFKVAICMLEERYFVAPLGSLRSGNRRGIGVDPSPCAVDTVQFTTYILAMYRYVPASWSSSL